MLSQVAQHQQFFPIFRTIAAVSQQIGIVRVKKLDLALADDLVGLAQMHQHLVKAAHRIRVIHLSSGVDGLVVVRQTNPRSASGEARIFAAIPLHRGAAVVAAALGDNVQRLGLGLVLLSQDPVVVEALDVAVLLDFREVRVRKGEFLGIMGASGSGKTTLLNCISTIDTVTSGHIYVEEKDITALHGAQLADFRGKKLGFIFQNFNLLDTLTAYENISLALSIAGTKPSEIEQRIPQIAQALNIQDVLGKYPYQMSGGQQQRVAAARAMVTNPAIVLADEPTGALDSNSSRMLLTMLTELNERLSATILMVTHDAFSASYCNRILFIKDGQVFNELHRGTDTRKEFFTKILEVVSVLGGEQSEHM